jgi:hypothetical protein
MAQDFIFDIDALNRICDLLNSGQDWNEDMLTQIAAIVRKTKPGLRYREVNAAPRHP